MEPSQGLDLQDGVYKTPMNLLTPVNKRWPLGFDLAALPANDAICRLNPARQGHFYSPENNSLLAPWVIPKSIYPGLQPGEWCWCNPPFDDIGAWTAKAAKEVALGARILMLLPAAPGARWLVDVLGSCRVVFLIGRITFDFVYPLDYMDKKTERINKERAREGLLPIPCPRAGKPNTDPYGKDMMLLEFSQASAGVEWWDWRKAA